MHSDRFHESVLTGKDQNATLARRHQEIFQRVEAGGQVSVNEWVRRFRSRRPKQSGTFTSSAAITA
ncbi:MAG TPA: hypothetical protein VGD78_19375 [Chthoniobacterales bacterium]